MISPQLYRSLLRPILFSFDAEAAHNAAIRAAAVLGRCLTQPSRSGKGGSFLGTWVANPLGLAAGLDKNGVAIPFFAALGFGHVEIGTVTPRPQPGNPRPRMFRFPRSEAIINRMGFPSHGAIKVARSLAVARQRLPDFCIGVNIGKNKDTPIEDSARDYCDAIRLLEEFADYVTINVSSPNTPDLRKLLEGKLLSQLLRDVQAVNRLAKPLCVKLSPDMEDGALEEAVGVAIECGCRGVIATNTTLQRPALIGGEDATETGGLSGVPLQPIARTAVRKIVQYAAGKIEIVGVGGIRSARDAHEFLAIGCSALQIYSALIYQGPGLVGAIARELPTLSNATDEDSQPTANLA